MDSRQDTSLSLHGDPLLPPPQISRFKISMAGYASASATVSPVGPATAAALRASEPAAWGGAKFVASDARRAFAPLSSTLADVRASPGLRAKPTGLLPAGVDRSKPIRNFYEDLDEFRFSNEDDPCVTTGNTRLALTQPPTFATPQKDNKNRPGSYEYGQLIDKAFKFINKISDAVPSFKFNDDPGLRALISSIQKVAPPHTMYTKDDRDRVYKRWAYFSEIVDVHCLCGGWKRAGMVACPVCANLYHLACVGMHDAPPPTWACPICCAQEGLEYGGELSFDVRKKLKEMHTGATLDELRAFASSLPPVDRVSHKLLGRGYDSKSALKRTEELVEKFKTKKSIAEAVKNCTLYALEVEDWDRMRNQLIMATKLHYLREGHWPFESPILGMFKDLYRYTPRFSGATEEYQITHRNKGIVEEAYMKPIMSEEKPVPFPPDLREIVDDVQACLCIWKENHTPRRQHAI